MIEINYSTRSFIKLNGQVAVRVRWNKRKYEVSFITGAYAQKEKWNTILQKANINTIHHVRKMEFTASEINTRIAEFKEAIEQTFIQFSLQNTIPTPEDLKSVVNNELGRDDLSTRKEAKRDLKELFNSFLDEYGKERNWDYVAKAKYIQAYSHFTKANPKISVDNISVDNMYQLRDYYSQQEYKNRTAVKQFRMLKCFLKWINSQHGYNIPDNVLSFKANLKVIPRTVTFMNYNELMMFSNYHFKNEHLEKARDLWCFMAFTSLRYSDLRQLLTGNIVEEKRIEMFTIKTGEHIVIPLKDGALSILKKYKGKETEDGHVFKVMSDQKLNDAVKEAAKEAGLNRIITNAYYIGNKRYQVQNKYYEIISCHDARRTFVSCSLAMGIPPEVVMRCTGHRDYETMKPYIETTTETQDREMERWNKSQYRSQIISLLDNANLDEQKKTLEAIRSIMANKED